MADTPSLQPTPPQILQGSVFSCPICTLPFPFGCSSHHSLESWTKVLLSYNIHGLWLWCYHPDFAHIGEENSGQYLEYVLFKDSSTSTLKF